MPEGVIVLSSVHSIERFYSSVRLSVCLSIPIPVAVRGQTHVHPHMCTTHFRKEERLVLCDYQTAQLRYQNRLFWQEGP